MFKWLFKKKGCAKHMNNKLELCPDGMDKYEANIGMTRKPETKDLSR